MRYTSLPLILFVFLFLLGFEGYTQGIKGKDSPTHKIELTKSKKSGIRDPGYGIEGNKLILLVGTESVLQEDKELTAAFEFVQSLEGYSVDYSSFRELRKHPKLLREADLVWLHRSDTLEFTTR